MGGDDNRINCFMLEHLEETDHLEDLFVDRRIILK
jgi:hypothetical protein